MSDQARFAGRPARLQGKGGAPGAGLGEKGVGVGSQHGLVDDRETGEVGDPSYTAGVDRALREHLAIVRYVGRGVADHPAQSCVAPAGTGRGLLARKPLARGVGQDDRIAPGLLRP